MYTFPFEKLRVWQHARSWIKSVYQLTENFPKTEVYGLTSQIRRASVSVAANLAEGSSRNTAKDQAHFSGMAYSSLMETACLEILSNDLGYLSDDELASQRQEISEISNQINALRRTQTRS